ncbi:uncharacterized protein G2W53_006942 [Senna tora]|uniref:Uncharacterized protein n=1 Tax=Senna tora TaxID=362788 RepID=A0A834X5T1_9FABA|nr:uncharacterized protein G2W53_006942 [Senna tora]
MAKNGKEAMARRPLRAPTLHFMVVY